MTSERLRQSIEQLTQSDTDRLATIPASKRDSLSEVWRELFVNEYNLYEFIAALEARGLEIREKQMSNEVKEIGSVWKLKDMQFTPYEEGEELIYEGSYGTFSTREGAEWAGRVLSKRQSNLPRGNWVITEETLYE